jgi:hypothetical protein
MVILRGLESTVSDARAKADVAVSGKTKIGHLTKALLTIRDYKGKASSPNLLAGLERDVADLLHQVQLDIFLDAARKAEFKGQRKKALDQYYEALYFLKNDDIEDSLQAKHISAIETKIAELGGSQSTSGGD